MGANGNQLGIFFFFFFGGSRRVQYCAKDSSGVRVNSEEYASGSSYIKANLGTWNKCSIMM